MVDPTALEAQYEYQLKVSYVQVHVCMNKCIDEADIVPELVIQMQKYFLKGRPERGVA